MEIRLREQEMLEPVTVRYRRKSGESFPAETVASALRDQNGQFIGLIKLIRDISKQVVQDEALRKSQRMEAIGQLTGGIAHDFNNLLTIITGNHELLEMELRDARAARPARPRQQRGADGRAPDQPPAHVRAPAASRAGRSRSQRAGAGAWRSCCGARWARRSRSARCWRRACGSVQADPSEVENAVLNLAINSRDAMPAGGKLVIETANVVLEESDVASEVGGKPGEYVRLSVSDTGAGMSKEVLARVFEPFFTTKEPGKGTGLGLSVIYGFVKQSGGHVTVYSELGRGTTVNLYLPRIATERGAAASARQPTPATQRRARRCCWWRTIPMCATSPRSACRTSATSWSRPPAARERCEALRSGAEIDLVFSDVVMPGGMSGFELAHWMQENAPAVPVLLTSGFAEDVARRARCRRRSWRSCASPIRARSWRGPCARHWTMAPEFLTAGGVVPSQL